MAENDNKDVEMKAEDKENQKEEVKAEEKEEKPKEVKAKEAEKPTEQEQDAAEETRPKVSAGACAINAADSTLNVMPSGNGKVLMTLSEGGFQHLFAGARATVGVKAGRYLMEVRVVECHKGLETPNNQGRMPQQRHMCRIGLSHAGSSLFLGEEENVAFDSEGFFFAGASKKHIAPKWEKGSTMGLLINLEEGSPAANTISLFRDGVRVCKPQSIPQKMLGKPLYPTVTYKSVTLQVNFGAAPLAPLPFKCHMLSDAAVADVEVASVPEPKGGKCEVLFPIGLPEQGYFDWVDSFIQQNPDYTELSDRKIIEWAAKSGMSRPKGSSSSNDKPEVKFGIPCMDDMSVRSVLKQLAPTARRNFVVPELRANLLAEERKKALLGFPSPDFKKSAAVVMGESTAEFKEFVQSLILADKKTKAEVEQKRKAAEEERKRLIEEKKRRAEEARRARLIAQGKEVEEATEELVEEPKEITEVVVELTEEEKALKIRKTGSPDVTELLLSKCYSDFSLPSAEEGFDDISYKWQGEGEAAKILKDWIFSKKLTQRVETIQPGDWFKEESGKWTKTLQEWRKLQTDAKNPAKKKAMLAAKAEAKKKEAEEKGDESAPAEPMEIDFDELDVLAVEDVADVGSGDPLFLNFSYEDWLLLSTRVELHLLLHSFKKDLDDPDRPSFTEKDLAFYYNKYFKKAFNLNSFGAKSLADLVKYIKDTVTIGDNSFLNADLADDTPVSQFVKLAESHRRERLRRSDAGDETAELKFPRNAMPAGQAGLKPTQPAGLKPSQSAGLKPQPPSAPPTGVKPALRPGGVRGPTPPVTPPSVGVKRGLTPTVSASGGAAGTGLSSSFVAKQPRVSPFGRGAFK